MSNIVVDFENIVGKIKPMHAVNMGPRQGYADLSFDFTAEYVEIGVPYIRLHDVEYEYGANQYVDIHCIFPDFDADVELESSYNFTYTDKYLKAIENANGRVFYRLGESIDHYKNPLYIHPPKDMKKWARICEHIIRHYNEGWADGFQMRITYWEIWNEPDNKKMWTGTKEEFFELYRITANHLKECFGDRIKVGGCAFSGFYANNREDVSEWFQSLVPYMHDFFSYITNARTKAPMDFFSWHCYADTPEEIGLHAQYAENMIRQYNLKNCENILNEFNMFYCFSEYSPYHKGCFADLAASMILAQKSPIDMMMHYGAFPRGTYNNWFNLDIDETTVIRFAGFESAADFGKLYALGSEVKVEGDIEGKLNVLAATDGIRKGIMVVSRKFEGEIHFQLLGVQNEAYSVKCVTDSGEKGTAVIRRFCGVTEGEDLTLEISPNMLLYLLL